MAAPMEIVGARSRHNSAQIAACVLRLLSDEPWVDLTRLDWSAIRAIGERNHMMARLLTSFERRSVRVSNRFEDAARRQIQRTVRVLSLTQQIGEVCERLDIPHAFLKLADRYPDTGTDLDLLIGTEDAGVDARILDRIPAIARTRRIDHRLAGTATYTVPTYDTVIDVHHRRLGRLGEQTRAADLLLRRRRIVNLGSTACYVPSCEDQLLTRALGQFARYPCLRLADVHETISVVHRTPLDWPAIIAEADATGLLPSLSCHLDYVDQVHRQAFGRPLLDQSVRARLRKREWGNVVWRDDGYRFSTTRASGPVFVDQLLVNVTRGDWSAVGRTLLLPLVAASATWRQLRRRFNTRS